jgi:hypothetical protein
MTMKERCVPTWMPPDGTVLAVAAGEYWDAVVVPQTTGLAVLSLLDASTRHAPGPIIWDTGRQPRLYFLIPTASGIDLTDTVGVLLTSGSHIAVPGPTALIPPGPYWLAPPDPDSPDTLTDHHLLSEALRLVGASSWAEYRTADGEARQVLVTAEQMEGLACLRCGSAEAPLHPSVAITTRVADGVVSTTVSVVCTPCLVIR